jgi:hypothetical protein
MERKRGFSWLKNWRLPTLCGGCIVAGFLLGMLIFGSPWHLPPAWGDIPTWITAIATAGLLTGAIITARYAIKASDDLTSDEDFTSDEPGGVTARVTVVNTSDQPVYTAIPRS